MTTLKLQINVFVWFYLLFQIATGLDLSTCGPESDPSMAQKVRLVVLTGNATDFITSETTADDPKRIRAKISPGKPTIVYIHGYTESSQSNTVQSVAKAYLQRGDVNVITVDWSKVAKGWNYFSVTGQLPAVGKVIAVGLRKIAKRVNLSTLHLIGHSLGAHTAGFVAKFLNVTVARITGLDPALPSFYPGPCHISADDAKAVVIIHTNGGFLGVKGTTGSIDFYPNYGSMLQPGCWVHYLPVLCSHQRSVEYFAESINNPKAFPARKCQHTPQDAPKHSIVYLSDSTPSNAHGKYCFTTNSQSPFGKGIVT